LRRNDRIDRVLEHQHAVGGGDRHRTAGAALTDDDCDHRHLQREALFGRAGDGFGLSPLLRLDPWKSTRRIDQRDDWNTKLVREPHQADRLAIALGFGHPEIVLEPRSGVVAFLVPDQHYAATVDTCKAPDNRWI